MFTVVICVHQGCMKLVKTARSVFMILLRVERFRADLFRLTVLTSGQTIGSRGGAEI